MDFSWTDLLYELFDLFSAMLLVVGGVAAIMLLKNAGSAVLLVGALLGMGVSISWIGYQVGMLNGDPQFFQVIRIVESCASLLTAAGVLLLLSLAGVLRWNKTLGAIAMDQE